MFVPSDHNVLVVGGQDNRFHPDTVEVAGGPAGRYELTFTVVTGAAAHTIESDAIGFGSGRVEPGQTIRFSFAGQPGTYEFYCRYHNDLGMVGTITLR